ncbi:C-terminal binding protein [Aeromonas caviae]|uniref:C-terminal binding protein n=1 Tax=Aeromonas caviae TaxID=648 RepID=UPI003F747C71
MKKIVVIEPGYADYVHELAILEKYASQIEVVRLGTPSAEVITSVRDADAIMVREAKVDEAIISNLEKCKVIVRYGVGVDNIDLEAAKKKGIYVANVPDYGSEDVAEHAVALMLSAARRIPSRSNDVKAGVWGVGQAEPLFRVTNKVMGIVGFGRIARCFAKKVSGFEFSNILVFDPLLTETEANELNVKKCELEDLFSESDFISLHVPLNEKTRHMVDHHLLSKMKRTAILINTGRGGIINEDHLYEYLRDGKIFAAALDVFDKEPLDITLPMVKLNNVITTDHTAWFTEESVIELHQKAAYEVLRVLEGQEPKNWVNK